jgi:hypothetical protein
MDEVHIHCAMISHNISIHSLNGRYHGMNGKYNGKWSEFANELSHGYLVNG